MLIVLIELLKYYFRQDVGAENDASASTPEIALETASSTEIVMETPSSSEGMVETAPLMQNEEEAKSASEETDKTEASDAT
jgi:hypothetical protein